MEPAGVGQLSTPIPLLTGSTFHADPHLAPSDFAGRAYAAYGGVYIAASLVWLWAVEKQRPDTWDMTGVAICLAGAAVILYAPRA